MDGKEEYVQMRCRGCGLILPGDHFDPSDSEAIAAAEAAIILKWNTRLA